MTDGRDDAPKAGTVVMKAVIQPARPERADQPISSTVSFPAVPDERLALEPPTQGRSPTKVSALPMMECAACTTMTPVGNYCSECGAALPVRRFCSECGAQLKPGGKFCEACGQKVP